MADDNDFVFGPRDRGVKQVSLKQHFAVLVYERQNHVLVFMPLTIMTKTSGPHVRVILFYFKIKHLNWTFRSG